MSVSSPPELASVPHDQEIVPCTQAQLARLCGVSQMTVNRALNGHASVRPEVRARIMAMMEQHGYRPHASARVMRTGRFGGVALLASTDRFRSFTPPQMLDGIHDELARHDLHLMFTRLLDEQLTNEEFVPKILREWMSDGLLISYTNHIPRRLIEIIERNTLPVVWINSDHEADCIAPDDAGAAQSATRLLLDMGHRHIAFAIHARESHSSATTRRRAYEEEMKRAGLPTSVFSFQEPECGSSELEQAMQWLRSTARSGEPRPTAIIAYEDRSLLPLLAASWRLGLDVPGELSLVAFHHTPISFVGMPVTTVVSSSRDIGQQAVQMLLQKVAQPSLRLPPQTLGFQVEMGQTCAPPQS